MIVKSLLAGVVLAGMAGGGVYYGLSPVEGEMQVERKNEPIAPKKLTVKKVAEAKAHPHPERKKVKTPSSEAPAKDTGVNEDGPEASKKWIDQYVNKTPRSGAAAAVVTGRNDTEKTITPDMSDMDAKVAKRVKDAKARAKKMRAQAQKARDKARAERDMANQRKAHREAKAKFVVKDTKAKDKKPSSAIGRMESFDTIDIIMREAEDIESTDLRDRAYLNVVDYALMHGYFGKAKVALAEITQPELRETARSRIAVRYAGTGNPEAAFDLVDGVEMTDFKDAMRIQIIEALIAAESQKNRAH